MIEGRFEGPELSGEELRELLRDAPLEEGMPSDGKPPASRHVMLVSRRRDDLDLLRTRLEAHGAAVTIVRNPFSALDQLRRAVYEGVVADIDLWAHDASLLIDRMRPRETGIPLLLVADRARDPDGRLESRLREAGAMAVVFRPFRPSEVERLAIDFLSPEKGLPEASANGPGEERSAAGSSRAPDETPEGRAVQDADPRAEAHAAEVRWLRFFLCAHRGLRHAQPDPRCRSLLEAAREHLGCGSSAVLVGGATGSRAWLAGAPGLSPETLLDEMRGACESAGPDPAALVVRCATEGGSASLVLCGLPESVRNGARDFVEDLDDLVRAAVHGVS